MNAIFEISSNPSNLYQRSNAMSVSNYGYDGYFAFFEQKSGDNRILLLKVDLENETLDQSTSIASHHYPMSMQCDSTGIQYILAFDNSGYQMIKVSCQNPLIRPTLILYQNMIIIDIAKDCDT